MDDVLTPVFGEAVPILAIFGLFFLYVWLAERKPWRVWKQRNRRW